MSDYGNSESGGHGRDCRTCTDFKTWARRQKERMHSDKSKQIKTEKITGDANGNNKTICPKDCPLDKDSLGNATWSLLHTIGATYPNNPTPTQKKDVENFMDILSRIYPCEYCASDLRKDLRELPVQSSSQHAFSQWLCKLHNKVNLKLGKPVFDCSKVNERWRDGSCDL